MGRFSCVSREPTHIAMTAVALCVQTSARLSECTRSSVSRLYIDRACGDGTRAVNLEISALAERSELNATESPALADMPGPLSSFPRSLPFAIFVLFLFFCLFLCFFFLFCLRFAGERVFTRLLSLLGSGILGFS